MKTQRFWICWIKPSVSHWTDMVHDANSHSTESK